MEEKGILKKELQEVKLQLHILQAQQTTSQASLFNEQQVNIMICCHYATTVTTQFSDFGPKQLVNYNYGVCVSNAFSNAKHKIEPWMFFLCQENKPLVAF